MLIIRRSDYINTASGMVTLKTSEWPSCSSSNCINTASGVVTLKKKVCGLKLIKYKMLNYL